VRELTPIQGDPAQREGVASLACFAVKKENFRFP